MRIHEINIPAPANWQSFEKLSHGLWMTLLADPNTQLHGRQGQPQAGVDVYGNDLHTGDLYGIQCKGKNQNYGQNVTKAELLAEVENAKTFGPRALDVFILATTAPNDQKIQKLARTITEQHKKAGLFKVYVYGWEEIQQRIPLSESVIEDFYPEQSNKLKRILEDMDDLLGIAKRIETAIGVSETVGSFIDRKDAVGIFEKSSHGLVSWPNTLRVDNSWIDRKEQLDIDVIFDNDLYSTTVILGDPGTGKSALLSRMAAGRIADGEMVLAIKADQLAGSIKSFADLGRFLGLPAAVDICINQAARMGKVFLFVDQLDTLSELIDVRTERLSILLSLINQLSGWPNIHILASSRPFEFKHDSRFSTVKAKQVILPNLDWEQVKDRLTANGITLTEPDQEFRLFLTRPSNLNFYLSYIRTNPHRAFASHIELYEDIWLNSLGAEPSGIKRRDMLIEMATTMTNEASQALPLLRYDDMINDVNWLVNAGLLVKTNNDKSISFAHQTLQAFVWTRSFIKESNSIYDFIITHQSNLNIRPKLSTVLLYLRDANAAEYNKQLAVIFNEKRSTVRKHIQHLVVDCITAHHDPNSVEHEIISTLIMEDEFRVRICNSVAGKLKWFDLLSQNTIVRLVEGSENEKFSATFLLSSVYMERKNQVLDIIRDNWMDDTSINFVFYVLRNIDCWDEQLFELACGLIRYELRHPFVPSYLYQTIKEKSPEYAVKLAAANLANAMGKLIAEEKPIPSLSDEATMEERIMHNIQNDPKHPYENLLGFSQDWYGLPDIAIKVPLVFVTAFWETFLLGCKKTTLKIYSDDNSYDDCSGTWFHLSEEGEDHGDNYFSTALERSISIIANESQEEFLNLYHANKESSNLPVQRLLTKGLVTLAPSKPTFVLEQLLGEERRFKLGYYEDRYSGTKELISALSPHLNEEELAKLQTAIRQYKAREFAADNSHDGKRNDMAFNRVVVYSLLAAIPEALRDETIKRQMAEDERALGRRLKTDYGYSGFLRAKSPMSEEQMNRAKDEDIIQCITEFPDTRGDDWPSGGSYVSSNEFAREFEKYASNNAIKAVGIIERLELANINMVTHGLIGLSRSNLPWGELLSLIETLAVKFPVSDFYSDAVVAIEARLGSENVLTEEWINRIKTWLSNPQGAVEPTVERPKQKEKRIESILWGHHRSYFVPTGNYAILDLLTKAMFQTPSPLVSEWVGIIKDQIIKGDGASLWAGFMGIHFPHVLQKCDPVDGSEIISLALTTYPELMGDGLTGRTLVRAIHWADDSIFFGWLDLLVKYGSEHSYQLMGELLVAKLVIHPANETAKERLDALVVLATDQSILLGIAFALKNVWRRHRPMATPYFVKILGFRIDELSVVLLRLLSLRDDLEQSEDLNRILDAMIENSTLETKKERVPFLSKALASITAKEPHRIAALAKQLITSWGRALSDVSSVAVSETPDLITIAITLHNSGPAFQSIGLDIFESLLDLDVYQIKDVLLKIDGVPKVSVATVNV